MKTTLPKRALICRRAAGPALIALASAIGSVAVGSGAAVAAPLPSGVSLVVVAPSIVGELGDGGWYVTDVSVGWSILNLSGAPISTVGCGTNLLVADTAGYTSTCTVTSITGTQSFSITVARDATAPDVTVSPDRAPDQNGWYRDPVTFTVSGVDALSGISPDACSASVVHTDLDGDGVDLSVGGTCADDAGSVGAGSATYSYDATSPSISATLVGTLQPDGSYLGPVTVEFECDDSTSGIEECPADLVLSAPGTQAYSGVATDRAGNSAATSGTVTIITDVTPPTITWVDGPTDGAVYVFGDVPPPPTCEAADADSGPAGCTVSGYDSGVGTHTLVATAFDVAGNEAVETRTYTVAPWTITGFAKPVTAAGSPASFNSAKAGKTESLKFEIFAGASELTSSDTVAAVTTTEVTCQSDPATIGTTIATTTIGYQAGRFVVEWTAPPIKGRCYLVTVRALDGSALGAYFKAK